MIRKLPPELAKIARDELNENPNQTEADLRNLKEWISKQPHLRARTDDQWLIAMLRGCKFSLERVKKKLDLYYTLRTTAADFTLRIRPTDPKFIDFFRLGTCTVLRQPKAELYPRVILLRVGVFDPAVYNVADLMCMLYYLVQMMIIENDVASVLGTKIVVDYEGVTMNHFVQATPAVCKKMVHICQDSMPLRLKGSHHVNLPSGVDKIFTIMSVFLNEKAKQRLKVHRDCKEIMEHIPKEIVPEEYGGSGGTVADITEYWVSKLLEYQDWMRQEEQLGTDESKRQGQPPIDDLMGDGSFRKLDID